MIQEILKYVKCIFFKSHSWQRTESAKDEYLQLINIKQFDKYTSHLNKHVDPCVCVQDEKYTENSTENKLQNINAFVMNSTHIMEKTAYVPNMNVN